MRFIKYGFLVFLFLFLASSLIRNIFNFREKLQFYQGFKNELEKERKSKTTLQTKIIKESDLNEIEKTIRDKLNLSKQGEYTIILPNPTPTVFIPTPTPIQNYMKWWNLFF